MPLIGHRLLGLAGFLAAVFWPIAGLACNVPVFRYALERWEADAYPVIVFHKGPLSAEQQRVVQSLEKPAQDGLANLTVSRVDLAQEPPPPMRALWDAQGNPSLPWMVVRYPKPAGIETPTWAGPLSAENVGALLESPARRELTKKLLNGDAVVWLLLEGADKSRNEAAGKLIEIELWKLEETLRLPERSPLDPPINPDLPLKIAFSTLRLSRADPAEKMLFNLLLNWNTNLLAAQEPMLVPVFGRGRAVSPAVGEEIRPEAIREMAEFLTGPCSCEVKTMNPGYDLLLSANWSSLAGYQEYVLPATPPLVGMSQLAAAATNATTSPALPRDPAAGTALATSPAAEPAGDGRLLRNVLIVLGASVGLIAAATWVVKRRGRIES